MIGILLITHGTFGESLVQNVSHILGARPALIGQLGVLPRDNPPALLPQAQAALKAVDGGAGVLIMTDMLGASPSRLAMHLLEPGRIEGVAGLNLPMLLRAMTYRQQGMEILVQKALSGGREGVINMHRQTSDN